MRFAKTFLCAMSILPLLAISLANCNSSSSGGGGAAAVSTITPEGGGVIEFTDETGAMVNIEFPPGAVVLNTEIMLAASAVYNQSWLNLTFEPIGLNLLAPAIVTIIPPDDVTLTEDTTLYYVSNDFPIPIPTTVDSKLGALVAEVYQLGYLGDTAARTTGHKSNSGFIPRNTREDTGNIQQIAVEDFNCATAGAAATQAFKSFANNGEINAAIKAYNAIRRLEDKVGCAIEKDLLEAEVFEIGCKGYNDAKDKLVLTFAYDYGEFQKLALDLVEWVGNAKAAGQNCANDYQSVLEDEIKIFLVNYRNRIASDPDETDNFFQLHSELWINHDGFYEDLYVLGLEAFAPSIESILILPMAKRLRDRAYALSMSTGHHHYLSRATPSGIGLTIDGQDWTPPTGDEGAYQVHLGYDNEDIWADINYVGTNVIVTVNDFGNVVSEAFVRGNPDGPGNHTTDGDITITQANVDSNSGFLDIFGTIPKFSGRTRGDVFGTEYALNDEIVVDLLHGNSLQNRTNIFTFHASALDSDHIGDMRRIALDEMFEKADVTFSETGKYVLEIIRRRPINTEGPLGFSPHDHVALFGNLETTLFTIGVNGGCATRGGSCSEKFTFESIRIKYDTSVSITGDAEDDQSKTFDRTFTSLQALYDFVGESAESSVEVTHTDTGNTANMSALLGGEGIGIFDEKGTLNMALGGSAFADALHKFQNSSTVPQFDGTSKASFLYEMIFTMNVSGTAQGVIGAYANSADSLGPASATVIFTAVDGGGLLATRTVNLSSGMEASSEDTNLSVALVAGTKYKMTAIGSAETSAELLDEVLERGSFFEFDTNARAIISLTME